MPTRLSARLAALAFLCVAVACGRGTEEPAASDAAVSAPGDAAAPPDVTPACPPGWSRRSQPPPAVGQPWRLSEAGLFCDVGRRVIAPGLMSYQPAHELWSDGADKRRWIELPEGGRIDTEDMDHWRFPVGTRVWKEFSRNGRLLETRLVERVGPGDRDYWMGAFLWDADGSDAAYVRDGATDVLGTDHDVPSAEKCQVCHDGEAGRVLGVSAIQLAAPARGLTLAQLVARGLLSHPPPRVDLGIAGPLRETFGYLHANCGHCHHKGGSAWRDADLTLRLAVSETRADETAIHRTSIGMALQKFRQPGLELRVVPGAPELSGLLVRMRSRDKEVAMPQLATKQLDPTGVRLVEAWIRGL